MSMDESQNRKDFELNPITKELDMVNDLEMGWSVKNIPKAPFFVKAGFTRVYPNLTIPDGMTIDIQDDGEMQVI